MKLFLVAMSSSFANLVGVAYPRVLLFVVSLYFLLTKKEYKIVIIIDLDWVEGVGYVKFKEMRQHCNNSYYLYLWSV